ncbi:plant UBX domain-containing protein 8 isoform X1 [Amborella trichopoda]|uniref:UBX domain-containing protein n=1 Tax=Amborella trichopoda TaxID=13333 RepID=U5DFZ4_AMBTC|nr:plant UBX domain-containing protein 8 isoform X1 [Amborella trichopoda]ERN19348.1 hypothetical protein AMTR_s00069p00109170 [Amborella trichopoda]|eukprot:XP_006857881.1 plant UBX domain-containing protein 8 isoform X1 [Amborella trichopoda]
MARPSRDAIETFMSITGACEAVAVQKLEAHGGDLNGAVNAYFNEGEQRPSTRPTSAAADENDFMDTDDPIQIFEPQRLPGPFPATSLNPLSLLDREFPRNIYDSIFDGRGPMGGMPRVSHPREVREIQIDFKDGDNQSGPSGATPAVEDVTGSVDLPGPEIRGRVTIDDDEEDVDPPTTGSTLHTSGHNGRNADGSDVEIYERQPGLNAPQDDVRDDGLDIEEEMLQAAIEASKREATESYKKQQTAEQEKTLREHGAFNGILDLEKNLDGFHHDVVERFSSNGSQGYGSSSKEESSDRAKMEAGNPLVQDEADDVEEVPLVRHRPRHSTHTTTETATDVGHVSNSPPSSPGPQSISSHPQHDFQNDEWGGISSEEHDEAVMLEAAMFGVPEDAGYRFSYPRRIVRPPSPTLAAQRLLREQQDDEYLASLQADQEKELKAKQEAELRCQEEAAAREAALERQRQELEDAHRKLLEEEELERQLAAKEASLPQEPPADNENAITLLVRMPDGSRRGRRFLMADKLQSLFDFIDVGRGVKPNTYRLVRPYPRRAFSDGEKGLSLSEVGLSSKLEALFLELI